MDWKNINVEIKIPDKIKKFFLLVVGTVLLTNILVDVMDYFSIEVYRVFKFLLPLMTAVPAIIYYVKDGRKLRELFAGNALKQIILGVIFGSVLLVLIWMINGEMVLTIEASLFDRYTWYKIYISVYYLVMVGFMEEFIYRIVIQNYFADVLGRWKLFAPALSALAFAMCHFMGGGIGLVLHNVLWGLIWGYLRYFCKAVTYPVLAISHGVYDFGLLVIPLIVAGV